LVGITIGQESAAARATSEDTVTALHEAIGVMSFICDYAQSGDAQGFNAADAYEGAPPQFCAFHYRGQAETGRLDAQLREEVSGGPGVAKIIQHQIGRGSTFQVVRTEPGGYDTEQRLKEHSGPGLPGAVVRGGDGGGAGQVQPAPGCPVREGRYEHGWESAAAEGLAANAKAQPDAAAWTRAEVG
jgi:hypothetical protein